MVTRRSRCYKENKPSAAISRIVLPMAVIMAVALLYLSIKLFFFEPTALDMNITQTGISTLDMTKTEKQPGGSSGAADDSVEIDEGDAATITPKHAAIRSTASNAAVVKAKVSDAPVKKAVREPQPQPQEKKTAAAAAEPVKQTAPEKTADKQQPEAGSASWEIQIGGFSDPAGAELTLKQAQEAGYSAYSIKTERGGKPFYKVRVKGAASKENAEEMSKALAEKGFPIYLIRVPGRS